MRFEQRVRLHAIGQLGLDERQTRERGDELCVGLVPADGFKPIGHRLRAFDEQHRRAIRRGVSGRAEIGKTGRLKARPSDRPERHFEEEARVCEELGEVHGFWLEC